MDITQFWTICSANSIVLSVEQLKNFERYHNELLYWNSKVNLISRKDEANIFEKHFLHSLSILKYIKIPAKAGCLDIGTGGGFPGLPIKIACPNTHMTLVDSIKKKTTVTNMFASHTGLRNIKVLTKRAEELRNSKDFIFKFDFIFARAVAKLSNLVSWTYDCLRNDGLFAFLKGGNLDTEIQELLIEFPKLSVKIEPLDIFGCDSFLKDDKKIVFIGKKPLEINDKLLRHHIKH